MYYSKKYERLQKRQQNVITCSLGREMEFCSVISFYQCFRRNKEPINLALDTVCWVCVASRMPRSTGHDSHIMYYECK